MFGMHSVKTLSAILHEGVTAFVALQDEMPSPMVTASIKESALPSKRAQVCARPRAALCVHPPTRLRSHSIARVRAGGVREAQCDYREAVH